MGDEAVKRIVTIKIQTALDYWKGVNPNVELTDERMAHIQEHHPDDYAQCIDHVESVIEAPDLILEDHKNPMTAMFIRSFEELGVNVIIKLALSSNKEDRSFIVTIHPVGERSIKKLENKNKVVYKSGSGMV